jgi:hypothetical protein
LLQPPFANQLLNFTPPTQIDNGQAKPTKKGFIDHKTAKERLRICKTKKRKMITLIARIVMFFALQACSNPLCSYGELSGVPSVHVSCRVTRT